MTFKVVGNLLDIINIVIPFRKDERLLHDFIQYAPSLKLPFWELCVMVPVFEMSLLRFFQLRTE